MRLCWHPNRRAGMTMTREAGAVTVVECPDCHAVVYGWMCMPELKTPRVLEEAEGA